MEQMLRTLSKGTTGDNYLGVWVGKDLKERAKTQAKLEHRRLSDFMRHVLWEYLSVHENKEN